MPEYVSRNTIEMRVVENWKRLAIETAKDRGDDLSIIQPFHPYQQTYGEVIEEIKNNTPQGLMFYRMMVQQLPWYDFQE